MLAFSKSAVGQDVDRCSGSRYLTVLPFRHLSQSRAIIPLLHMRSATHELHIDIRLVTLITQIPQYRVPKHPRSITPQISLRSTCSMGPLSLIMSSNLLLFLICANPHRALLPPLSTVISSLPKHTMDLYKQTLP